MCAWRRHSCRVYSTTMSDKEIRGDRKLNETENLGDTGHHSSRPQKCVQLLIDRPGTRRMGGRVGVPAEQEEKSPPPATSITAWSELIPPMSGSTKCSPSTWRTSRSVPTLSWLQTAGTSRWCAGIVPSQKTFEGPRIVERSTAGADPVDEVETGSTEPHGRGQRSPRQTKNVTLPG